MGGSSGVAGASSSGGGTSAGAAGIGGLGGAAAGTAGTSGTTGGAAGAFGGGGSSTAGTSGAAGAAGSGGSGGAEPGGPITIWIAGDSTVATKGGTPCPVGWGGQFAPLFDDRVTVVNSAIGGRSVRTWMYDVQNTKDASGECMLGKDPNGELTLQQRWRDMLDGMKSGDYLFIQFGINDGSPDCPRHVGIDAFKAEYGKMAQAARERGAHPVFVTPVSAIACNGNTPRGTRGGFVPATIEAGQTYDVPVIDLHQASVELYTKLKFCPIPGGDVSANTTGPVGDFFCDDHTHFAEPGAIEIAKLVAQAIADLKLGLAEYLK